MTISTHWQLPAFCLSAMVSVFLDASNLFAWDAKVTHPALSARAAYSSVLNRGLLQSLGLGFTRDVEDRPDSTRVMQWIHPAVRGSIQQGAVLEDGTFVLSPRVLNHFHDPTFQAPWTGAGLLEPLSPYQSSLLWAQDFNANFEWSWRAVRRSYFDALILTGTGDDRAARFDRLFQGVGHLIHLVQDLAQPAHVRNDAHFFDGIHRGEGMETWAFDNHPLIYGFSLQTPVVPSLPLDTSVNGLSPITQFWDRDLYDGTAATHDLTGGLTVGLAEHTNANYFSEDTLGREYPFPSTDLADYQNQDPGTNKFCADAAPAQSLAQRRIYLSRTPCSSGPPDPLAKVEYVATLSPLAAIAAVFPGTVTYRPELRLDNEVRRAYASRLIPRAVGYSAALIDYFFRNDIEISPPERFVYGVAAPNGDFTEIRVKARSTTSTGVDLLDGSIRLVLTYRRALEDPYRAGLTARVPTSAETTTIVALEKTGRRSIPSDTPVELVFDILATPLPLWATDLYAQVVYYGQAGSELDAVAVGYKDFSEPTPIDLMNLMDYVCLNGQYVVAGSQEALAVADLNHNGAIDEIEPDIFAHGLGAVNLRFSSADDPQDASSANRVAFLNEIGPAMYGRVWVLAEARLAVSFQGLFLHPDPMDQASHSSPLFTYSTNAVENQDTIVDGVLRHAYPPLVTQRGLAVFFGFPQENREFPADVHCDPEARRNLSPALSGPVSVDLNSGASP